MHIHCGPALPVFVMWISHGKSFVIIKCSSPVELNSLSLAHCSDEALGLPLMQARRRPFETIISAQKKHIFIDACLAHLIDLPAVDSLYVQNPLLHWVSSFEVLMPTP